MSGAPLYAKVQEKIAYHTKERTRYQLYSNIFWPGLAFGLMGATMADASSSKAVAAVGSLVFNASVIALWQLTPGTRAEKHGKAVKEYQSLALKIMFQQPPQNTATLSKEFADLIDDFDNISHQ